VLYHRLPKDQDPDTRAPPIATGKRNAKNPTHCPVQRDQPRQSKNRCIAKVRPQTQDYD